MADYISHSHKLCINYATAEEIATLQGISLEQATEIYQNIRKYGSLNRSGFLNLLKRPATRQLMDRIAFDENTLLVLGGDDEDTSFADGSLSPVGPPRDHSSFLKSPKEKLSHALEEIRSGVEPTTMSKGVHFMNTRPSNQSDDGWDERYNMVAQQYTERRDEPRPELERPLRRDYEEERRPTNRKSDAKFLPRNLQFDGKGNWETFISKFYSYAEYSGWTEKDKTHGLLWSLADKAADFHAMFMGRDRDLTFSQQVTRLANRYGDRELTETSQASFHQASQKVNEGLIDWSDRVQQLAYRAFRNLPEEHVSQQTIIKFCQGLVDKRTGEIVCTSRPRSIQEAIDAVKYHQHVHEAMAMEKSKSSIRYTYNEEDPSAYAVQPDRPSRNAHGYQPQQGSQASSTGKSSVESTLVKLQETLEKMMRGMAAGNYRNRRQASDSGCYKCGKEGHIKRWCPDLTQEEKDRYALNYRRGGKQ